MFRLIFADNNFNNNIKQSDNWWKVNLGDPQWFSGKMSHLSFLEWHTLSDFSKNWGKVALPRAFFKRPFGKDLHAVFTVRYFGIHGFKNAKNEGKLFF